MKYADIIVPRGKTNKKAIDFIVTNLKIKVPLEDLNDEIFSQRFNGSAKQGTTPQKEFLSEKNSESQNTDFRSLTDYKQEVTSKQNK